MRFFRDERFYNPIAPINGCIAGALCDFSNANTETAIRVLFRDPDLDARPDERRGDETDFLGDDVYGDKELKVEW